MWGKILMKTNGSSVNSFMTSEKSTGLGLDKVSAGTSISMMMMVVMMIIVIPCVLGRINELHNI